jgi:hypothetical protein
VPPRKTFKNTLKRPFWALVALLGHVVLASAAILGFWIVEELIILLWGEHEPKFFGWIPVKWFFDAGDAGILIVFGIFGIRDAYRNLKG